MTRRRGRDNQRHLTGSRYRAATKKMDTESTEETENTERSQRPCPPRSRNRQSHDAEGQQQRGPDDEKAER